MKFDIYTKGGCSHCVKAKSLLESKGYQYNEYTVGTPGSLKEDIQRRVAGLGVSTEIRTVPQIFVNKNGLETYIGGSDDLASKIDSL